MRAFYYGVKNAGQAGHFLHDQGLHQQCRGPKDMPFRYEILDGGLLPPNGPQIEGRAVRVQIRDWTIVTFWDRSGDRRMGSCSAFCFDQPLSFEAAIDNAIASFPSIFARFNFEITTSDREAGE